MGFALRYKPIAIAALFLVAVFLSGCAARAVVDPGEVVGPETEFAYVLVGIDYELDKEIASQWGFVWARRDDDVVFNPWTGYAIEDMVWTANASIHNPVVVDGIYYFLRKANPGRYSFYHSTRVRFGSGIKNLHAGDEHGLLEFKATKGAVTYIGTIRLDQGPDFVLWPISARDARDEALEHLAETYALDLPILFDVVELDGPPPTKRSN